MRDEAAVPAAGRARRGDPPILRRERHRPDLPLTSATAPRQHGDVLLAMLHYPPLGPGETNSEVLERLSAAGVSVAVYGHLHGDDHAWAPRGRFAGIALHFVAVNHTGFTPVEIASRP